MELLKKFISSFTPQNFRGPQVGTGVLAEVNKGAELSERDLCQSLFSFGQIGNTVTFFFFISHG